MLFNLHVEISTHKTILKIGGVMLENIFPKYMTAKNILFSLAALIFLVAVIKMQDIAIMFFASFVIACSLNPAVDKLSKKYNRPIAASIVLSVLLFVIALFFVPLIVLTAHEINLFAVSFPQYMDSISEFIQNSPFINQSDTVQVDIGDAISSASAFTSQVINNVVLMCKNIGSVVVYLIASLILIYYFMADKEVIKDTYARLFPKNLSKKAVNILDIISKKVGGYVVGQVATTVCVGVIMTIGLLILRVDYAVLLGLISAILDLIPVVGPAIALIICLIAAHGAGIGVLTGIAVVFGIAQIVENNFVAPYVFGKFLNLHPMLIYLFLFITAKYMGVIGVIFAPAIASTVCVLIEEVYMKNIN